MKTRSGILLLAIALLAGCSGEKAPPAARAADNRPEVAVFTVGAASSIAASGTARGKTGAYTIASSLMVEHEADLLAEEEGRLLEVLVDQGKRVKQGDVLVRLDDARLRKQLEQDRAEMQSMEVQTRQSSTLREAAEVELQRQAELRKDGLGNMRDFDRARFNLESMRHEVEKAKFEFARLKAKVEADEIRLSRLRIKAPFDGIVARRYVREGQMLLQNEKVLRLTELRPLLVRFAVPEAMRGAAAPGAVVEVSPAGAPATALPARVLRTGYVVDAASASMECIAQVQEPLPADLVPGMAVEVRIPRTMPEFSAPWIPLAAVWRSPDGSSEVFLVGSALGASSAARLQRRAVELGASSSSSVQILRGVSVGDRIVAQASAGLQDGMEVRIRP